MVEAIGRAKHQIQIAIFRFNRREIEKALEKAVERGVHVQALIACMNRGGERNLRELELRLLAAGVTVARTAEDLIRYHNKMMIIDGRELHLLAFNFTWLDMERSRSFGIVTTQRPLVREAMKLFDADMRRVPYTASTPSFIVSPVNARKQLAAFIKGARRELLIYDPEVSDPAMLRLLAARVKAGVDVKILGKVGSNSHGLSARKTPIRLHTRTIVRDGKQAFVGSQSLRTLELDARREAGVIVKDAAVINRLTSTFHADWEAEGRPMRLAKEEVDKSIDAPPVSKVAKRVAKAIVQELPPVAPVVETTVREIAGIVHEELGIDVPQVEATVKNAVKDAVKEVVKTFMEEAVQGLQAEAK